MIRTLPPTDLLYKKSERNRIMSVFEEHCRRVNEEKRASDRAREEIVRAIEKRKKKIKMEADRKKFEKRNRQIYSMRLAGNKLKPIGDQFGITPARVREICARQMVKEQKKVRAYHKNYNRGAVIDMGGQDGEWHTWTPESNARELGLI